MRLIGHLPNEANAVTFSDFLYVQGIANQVEREKEGWAVWIHSEDELMRARQFLASFAGNPADPKFRADAARAKALRERAAADNDQTEAGLLERARVFQDAALSEIGRLTFLLVLVCVGITGTIWAGYESKVLEWLLISLVPGTAGGLPEIRQGELWRLFTPVLVHKEVHHLLFNMIGLYYLGNMIEARQGPLRLAALVLAFGVGSNLAQFVASGPNFVGFSGALYGLAGYVWMRGRFDPASGLSLHPQAVTIMLVWFVLCLAGLMGNIANTAHGAGLVMGVAWGAAGGWLGARRRSEHD